MIVRFDDLTTGILAQESVETLVNWGFFIVDGKQWTLDIYCIWNNKEGSLEFCRGSFREDFLCGTFGGERSLRIIMG